MGFKDGDIGDLLAEGLGGEIVRDDSAQQAQVIDLTENNPVEQVVQEAATQQTAEVASEEKPANIEEESSLNTEVNDGGNEPSNETQETSSREQELLDRITELEGLPKNEFSYANEQLEAIDKFVKETGRSVGEYLKTQTVDYNQMSNDNVVKEYLKSTNPELTKEEIDVYFDAHYKSNEEDGKISLQQIQLKKDAATARKELIGVQDSYKMPNDGTVDAEEQSKLQKEFVNSMSSHVDEVKSIEFDINDKGESFTYNLSDEQRAKAKETSSNLDGYFDKYIDGNGKWDYDSLSMDMFIRDNFENIIRSVANQYKSKGTEQVIDEIKNPSFTPEGQAPTENKKGIIEQVSEQMFGNSSIWNR